MRRGRRRCAAICALGFFGLVAGQECSGTITIFPAQVTGDVTRCQQWDGTIVVAFPAPSSGGDGGFGIPPFKALSSLSTITGDITFTTTQTNSPNALTTTTSAVSPLKTSLTNKRAPQGQEPGGNGPTLEIDLPNLLGAQSGSLVFKDLSSVKLVPNLPKLESVQGIEFSNVNFGNWAFNGDNLPKLKNAYDITFKRTDAQAIGPLKQELEPVESFADDAHIEITDNTRLSTIELGGFTTFSNTYITVNNNFPHPSVGFENVENACLSMSGVRSFDAPNLATLTSDADGTHQFITDSTLRTLRLQQLATISGVLEITRNPGLTTIDFPLLTRVTNGLQVKGNANLRSVSIAEKAGDSVTGDITVDASGSVSCNSLKQKLSAATVTCPTSSAASLGGASSSSAASESSSGGSGLSTGAKAGIGVGAGIGALLLAGILIFLCCRRRRNKSYSSRELSAEPYSKGSQRSYTESGEMAYSKVPPAYHSSHSANPTKLQQYEPNSNNNSEDPSPTSALANDWAPPERDVPSHRDGVGLQEQQGMRHEMDARSLPDMDSDPDDEDADTRSLEDIERVHRQR